MSSGSFKRLPKIIRLHIMYLIYMNKQDLTLINLLGLKYHKIEQTLVIYYNPVAMVSDSIN